MGVPHELRTFLRLIGAEVDEDPSKRVVIGELGGEELKLYADVENCEQEVHKLIRKIKRFKSTIDASMHEIWERLEGKYGVPSNVNIEINPRTKQILMDRDDADHLKLKYRDQSVHPEAPVQ